MCEIWGDALDTPVGPDDDFFTLGGDSLLAVEIEEQVEQRLGLEIDFRDFFNAPTPRELLRAARARSTDGSGAGAGPGQP
ncbi:acyl carrier protein [Streptomyces sp. NBC_00536]|uniref:acyl carrier protein n=1 Tax=Streptomyces sp. NBC_00536 TaxID=2975769 RepID=UPI002E8223C0|nr:acyl carrier protein [Streptomyces sp. NBC_00536]WUC83272.1 acyl carrier protein [Streptomyces sp. NBC_00536]